MLIFGLETVLLFIDLIIALGSEFERQEAVSWGESHRGNQLYFEL